MRRFPSLTAGGSLLLALLLGGCAKDSGSTLVEGQVVDSQSGQPVGNLTVQVEQAGQGGGFGGGGFSPLGPSYPTDATGHFSFRFEAANHTTYIVRAASPLGYFTDPITAPVLRAGRKNQDVRVSVLAPAWVRLQLVDELPKSRVSMIITGYSGSGERLNFPKDTILIRPVLAGFARKIIWVITDNQRVDTQYSQDVQPAALDTVDVRIAF